MFKRFSLLLAGVAFLLSSTGVHAFFDVDGTRYQDAYALLQERGAVEQGRPYDAINRAEALKVILEMHEKLRERVRWHEEHPPVLPLFLDVAKNDWPSPYAEAAFEAGIVTGYPDRTFRPGSPLKVEEALALILRSYDEASSDQAGQPDWYTAYVQTALQKNLIAQDENLYVGYHITRGQFFDMIYRLDTIRSKNLIAFVDPNPRPLPPPSFQPVPPVAPPVSDEDRQYASSKNFAITIPRLGISDLTITHPSDALSSKGLLSVLKDGVGHLFSYPGRGGKIMVYGHSSSYAWDVSQFSKIFRRVNELKTGDRVYVTYNGTLHVYQVTGQRTIAPNDVAPFTGRGEELILFTCWPPGTIDKRLIVTASPVTTVALR